jgi:unsaturated rhamnogalacturonyl hydrolase
MYKAKKIMQQLSWVSIVIVCVCCAQQPPQKTTVVDFATWPKGCSPQEIGKRVADHFVATPHSAINKSVTSPIITYPEACAWYGSLQFTEVTKDKQLLQQLVDRFEPLFGKEKNRVPIPDHVDLSVFGSIPLELYIQTKEQKYLDLGKLFAEKQWGQPEGSRATSQSFVYFKQGFSWQTRLWIDDMFMITALQTQAYCAIGDKKYLDRAASEMAMYLDSLQQPNGLFYHAPDVPYFWGRGNGWMACGMSLLLKELDADHPKRARIVEGYRKMMATLLQYQNANGMWHQLIDKADAWPETSCSAMFTFAFITGVKNGLLDKTVYGPAARKGWLGVVKNIDDDANTHEVCEGTNKKNDIQYYYDRKRIVGDMHGQAPVLWCATALLR